MTTFIIVGITYIAMAFTIDNNKASIGPPIRTIYVFLR